MKDGVDLDAGEQSRERLVFEVGAHPAFPGAPAQGRQFHGKAEAALKRGDLAAAIQNMQMAMTFEANNAGFKAMLAELRERQKAGR